MVRVIEVFVCCCAGRRSSLGKCRGESPGGRLPGAAARSEEAQSGEHDGSTLIVTAGVTPRRLVRGALAQDSAGHSGNF